MSEPDILEYEAAEFVSFWNRHAQTTGAPPLGAWTNIAPSVRECVRRTLQEMMVHGILVRNPWQG